MRSALAVWVVVLHVSVAAAQPATLRVHVRADGRPVADAEVSAASRVMKTDAEGLAVMTLPPATIDVIVLKPGFAAASVPIALEAGREHAVIVDRPTAKTVEEAVVVSATRTEGRLEDQPMRVEVLDREEIEEKMLMTPGDIVMMLNEMGGMRVQATSPSLGAASVRIQGMRGRYTRFLSDGLPLFGEVGGLGLLQIPPMDLGAGRSDQGRGVIALRRGRHGRRRQPDLAPSRRGGAARAAGQPIDARRDRCGRLAMPPRCQRAGA